MKPQDYSSAAAAIPEKVPGRSHYSLQYVAGGRIFSFAHQIDTVISFEPRSVLEIGVGTGIVTAALRAIGLAVTTLDIQPELNPDLLGSVTAIPADKGTFDVALCSQVLEHLPFEQFRAALSELRRVTKNGLILSLPDPQPNYFVLLRLPKIRRFHWAYTRHRFPSHDYVQSRWELAGHYWEIGDRGNQLRDIKEALRNAQWHVVRTWRVPEKPYHRFFKLNAV
jgi:ubiquinone/menaquinone biosynthesis C-methylase UbiE